MVMCVPAGPGANTPDRNVGHHRRIQDFGHLPLQWTIFLSATGTR
jgi:hypothetical protein